MLNQSISFSRSEQLSFINQAMKVIKDKVGKSARKMSGVMGDSIIRTMKNKIDHFYPNNEKRLPTYKKYVSGTYKLLGIRKGNLINSLSHTVNYTRSNLSFNINITSSVNHATPLEYGYIHYLSKKRVPERPFMSMSIKNVINNYKAGKIK